MTSPDEAERPAPTRAKIRVEDCSTWVKDVKSSRGMFSEAAGTDEPRNLRFDCLARRADVAFDFGLRGFERW